jgi:hypothetical protein
MQTITEQFGDDEMERRIETLNRVLTRAVLAEPPAPGKE